MKRIHVLGALALFAITCASGQEFRGAISGVVTDATGAGIAGAKLTITENNTATKVETKSDSSGHYNVPFLLPGDYDIAVHVDGFKEFLRKGLHLGAGETPTIDVKLEVGGTHQTVEITDAVPMLNTENASIGQTITTKEIEDLPSNGGTPMMVAQFAMGVTAMSQPSQVLPFASGGAASWSIAGSANQTNELLVDGVPNATWDGRQAYSPPQDAVSEVRVKAFDSDASYGHTGGGTANQILKSGTNTLHGTASWKNQPGNLVANDFFRNKSGLPVQYTHFNQYGATAGGPVLLPKIMDGRNKLFWFFAFEGVKDSQPATTFLTVPTAAEKTGDFSALLNTKSATPTILYDPYSAVMNGTTVTRTAYAGNRIPSNQLSPIALKYLGFFPDANVVNGARDDGYNNFGTNAPSNDGYTNELGRLDYNINPRNRTYFNVRHTDYYQDKNDYFSNISTGSHLSRNNWGTTLDHVYMLNASNVINVRVNFTRMFEDHSSPSAGFDPTTFGFPAYLGANSLYGQMPTMTFANTQTNLTTIGFGSNANLLPSQSLQLFGNWTMIRGSHNIKVGGDARQYRLNYRAFGNSTGNFSFSANNWVRQSSSASSTVAMGQDFAEFLLGLPTSGSYDLNTSASYYGYYGALFVHDDWRIARNLTLNLGLRYDHDFPYHEKWGRVTDGFAYDAVNPLAAAAQAAYAKSPSPLLPASAFQVRGGLTFASPQNNAIYDNTSHLLSPRIGLAWTPSRFNNKLAVRSGFAMFVQPMTIASLAVNGAYSSSPLSLQPGFSQTTTMTVTNNNYLSPAATLANPFPSGFLQPAGSSAGLLTNAGQAINFMNPLMKSPYSVRWNLSLQYQLTNNLVIEAAYIGNHSVHLPVTYTQLNGVPRQFLSNLLVRDQGAITALTATVPNPFLGLNTAISTNTTISTAQLVSHYPEFITGATSPGSSGIVMNDNSVGSSYYNSLNFRAQQRLSNGISLIGAFMYSKMIDATTWLNDSDPTPERRISPFYRPMRFSLASTYALPFGKGHRLLGSSSRLVNAVLGGWQLNATYQFQVGGPLTWLNGSTNNPGDYVYMGGDLNSQPRNVDGYAFDITRFDNNTARQFQYHVRTFATAFANVRGDGINNFDGSLLKRFQIKEKSYLQFRAEVFNLVNHVVFSPANNTASNSAFGTITAQANRPRLMQFVLRLVF
jgi:Carboxypeptidase regulatory-like domain